MKPEEIILVADNELVQRSVTPVPQLPVQTQVTQSGENSVYAHTVNGFTQNIYTTGTTTLPVATRQRKINRNYYNLFVKNGEDFAEYSFTMDKDRILEDYSSEETISKRLRHLTPENIEEVRQFPSLFCDENTGYSGMTDPEQLCYFGYIDKIKKQETGIKIYFTPLGQIHQSKLMELADDLCISTVGVTTLNRTHWVIKQVDLLEVFAEAGIQLGMPIY